MAGVTFPAGVLITDRIQLESDAATVVYEALQGRTTILSIVAVEVGGGKCYVIGRSDRWGAKLVPPKGCRYEGKGGGYAPYGNRVEQQ
jgi:hypothetical protein